MRGFRPNDQGSNQENLGQGKGNQVLNYHNREGHYVRDGDLNRDNNFNQGNHYNKNDRSGPYVQPQFWEISPRDGGGRIVQVKHMLQKIMRRFDTSDEHAKELRGD